jgi:hypothetical protein
VCATQDVIVGGRQFQARTCAPASLPQLVCDVDADCTARGQTCSDIVTLNNRLTPVCGHPPSGAGALNATCNGSAVENPRQCASGFCDDAQDGRCVSLCETDADCGGGLICTASWLGNLEGRWCAEPCTDMAGCGFDAADVDSRVCKRRCDLVDQRFELACTPPVGTKNLNEALTVSTRACTLNSQCLTGEVCSNNFCAEGATFCRSGFSVTTGGISYCSQPCEQDNDCGTGMTCTFDSRSTCGGGAEDAFTYCRRQ